MQTDGEVLHFGRTRADLLLAYLALHHDQDQPRDRAAEALWPDISAQHAMHNLRESLRRLRSKVQLVVSSGLLVTGDYLGFSTDVVDLDLAHIESLVTQHDTTALLNALDCAHAELLPGYTDPWVMHAREEQNRALRTEGLVAMNELLTDQSPARALRIGQLLLSRDPYDETIHALMFVCFSDLGDLHGLQTHYRRCVRDIREGLDDDPAPRTTEQYRAALERIQVDFHLA